MLHASILLAAAAAAGPLAQTSEPETTAAPAAESSLSARATFVFGNERLTWDVTDPWAGFVSGLRGFEHFYNPVGNPIYFETPFNNSGLRFIFLHHEFPDDSTIDGGDLNVYALQIRVALTERLGFIATKDGYSELDAGALPEESGWNDFALGLKYVLYFDREEDFIATAGARYMFDNGDDEVLQGGVEELSPFISLGKGWDKFHLLGDFTVRVPMDSDDGNTVIQADLHADYEIFKGFAPLASVHLLHYADDGERTPLDVGGLDYSNLGSTDVAGSTVVWMEVGARAKLSPNFTLGAAYGFALTNPDADIMDSRVTVDFEITW